MSISTFALSDQELVVSRFEGAIDDGALLAHYRSLLARDDVPLDWNELIDLRGVTDFEGLTPGGLAVVARLVTEAYRAASVQANAVVLATDDLAFGLARMYELGRTPEEVPFHVCRTVAEALERLGVGDDAAAEVERLLS